LDLLSAGEVYPATSPTFDEHIQSIDLIGSGHLFVVQYTDFASKATAFFIARGGFEHTDAKQADIQTGTQATDRKTAVVLGRHCTLA